MEKINLQPFIPIEDQRDVLIYAFRYTLGRSTYAPHTIISILKTNWDLLSDGDKKLYQREIKEAIDNDMAGQEMDRKAWASVLDLPITK